jgi:nucleoside-diphosphate-sugar epimerase
MKILLTGSAGGIGSTLGYYLYKKGHTLTLIDNLRNGYLENLTINGETFGKFYNLDICNSDLVNLVKDDYDCIILFLIVKLTLSIQLTSMSLER